MKKYLVVLTSVVLTVFTILLVLAAAGCVAGDKMLDAFTGNLYPSQPNTEIGSEANYYETSHIAHPFSWNGTAWTDNMTGPAGAAGVQGPVGADGVQGPQGEQGPAGADAPDRAAVLAWVNTTDGYTAPGTWMSPLSNYLGTTQANSEMLVSENGTVRQLAVRVTSCTYNATYSVVLYKNGYGTLLSTTWTALETGTKYQTAISNIYAGDLISFYIGGTTGTGNIKIKQCTVLYENIGD